MIRISTVTPLIVLMLTGCVATGELSGGGSWSDNREANSGQSPEPSIPETDETDGDPDSSTTPTNPEPSDNDPVPLPEEPEPTQPEPEPEPEPLPPTNPNPPTSAMCPPPAGAVGRSIGMVLDDIDMTDCDTQQPLGIREMCPYAWSTIIIDNPNCGICRRYIADNANTFQATHAGQGNQVYVVVKTASDCARARTQYSIDSSVKIVYGAEAWDFAVATGRSGGGDVLTLSEGNVIEAHSQYMRGSELASVIR